jgi:hypothetical protein
MMNIKNGSRTIQPINFTDFIERSLMCRRRAARSNNNFDPSTFVPPSFSVAHAIQELYPMFGKPMTPCPFSQ